MSIYFKQVDDDAELFLAPMPKWVTHYGFLLMVAAYVLLIIAAVFIHYPQKKIVNVLITKKSAITIMSFDDYRQLKPRQQITVELPIVGKINAVIDQNTTQLSKNSVINHLIIDNNSYNKYIMDTVQCKGEITLYDKTLLQKIIKN